MTNEVIQTNVLPPGCNQKNGPEPLPFSSSSRKLDGRPKVATDDKANNQRIPFPSWNEIASLFLYEYEITKKKKMRMMKGSFDKIVETVRKKV